MNPLKKLAGQTVIYGLSSVIPRFLSYFLVTLYTNVFKDPAEYGVVGDLYGLVVILNVIVTYGMETGYFWFSKNDSDADRVYSTSFISLLFTSSFFIFLTIWFAQPVANYLEYPKHPEYIWWFGIIIGVDAICAIPFVKLRRENKAMKFALLKLFNITVNVVFTLIFLLLLPWINKHIIQLPAFIYSPSVGVGYIFIANILSSVATLLLLSKDIRIRLNFDFTLWKRMLRYAFPLMIAGLAGTVNDAIDRQFIKYTLPAEVHPMYQLGVYFAVLKIAVILIVFVQTFRFAAEPFFFNYEKELDSKQVFADIMKYFVIFCLIIFIGTLGNLKLFRFMINRNYWVGMDIVPVMLLANVFVGIYLNLSIWYKLSGKTMYGAYIILLGASLTILINYFFVPTYGYHASAYGRLICYFVMTIVCYWLGQKNYRIPYNLKSISYYFFLSLLILVPVYLLRHQNTYLQLLVNNLLIGGFIVYILKREKLWEVLLNMIPGRKDKASVSPGK